MKRTKLNNISTQKGVVLLEALIAIVIFSFGILAISGLQASMIKNTAEATYRAEAGYIVQQKIGELMTNPIGIGGQPSISVSSLPNGSMSVTPMTQGRLLFRVTWQSPGEPQHKYEAITSLFFARDKV